MVSFLPWIYEELGSIFSPQVKQEGEEGVCGDFTSSFVMETCEEGYAMYIIVRIGINLLFAYWQEVGLCVNSYLLISFSEESWEIH